MKTSIYLALIVLISCSCKSEKPAEFDLAHINFKETIGQALKGTSLPVKGGKTTNWTLAQYDIFESADPKVMKFNGVDLSGKLGDSVNRVIIHYSRKDSTISFVELKVFSEPQVKALAAALDKKLGKAPYPTDAYTTVFSENVQYFNRVWIDPKTTIGHFFTDAMSKEKHEEARLAILNYSNSQVSELAALKGYSSSINLDVREASKLLPTANKK